MSVKIMAAVFESTTLGPTERLVMLALADHADDAGRCYPAMGRLCQRTGLSDRAIQKNVKALVEAGYLTVAQNAGQGGANVYIVHPTPEPRSPRNDVHPRTTFTTPPNVVRQTPERRSDKPSRTIIEPSDLTPSPSGQGDMFAKTAKRNDQPERVVSQPDPDFDEFWSAFPPGRKTDKRQALETFRRIVAGKHKTIPKTDPQVIIAGARRFAASNPDPQFTPIPTTWLNRERWVSDDPVPAAVKRVSDFRPGGVIR